MLDVIQHFINHPQEAACVMVTPQNVHSLGSAFPFTGRLNVVVDPTVSGDMSWSALTETPVVYLASVERALAWAQQYGYDEFVYFLGPFSETIATPDEKEVDVIELHVESQEMDLPTVIRLHMRRHPETEDIAADVPLA